MLSDGGRCCQRDLAGVTLISCHMTKSLLRLLRGSDSFGRRDFFGVRDECSEARIAVESFEIGILFNAKSIGRAQSVINGLL